MDDSQIRGQQVYDEIMAQIEPELVSAVLPTLAEKYKNEAPEQAEARNARYEAAYAEYDKRYAEYMSGLNGKVHEIQKDVREGIEVDARKEEESALKTIEQSFDTAA